MFLVLLCLVVILTEADVSFCRSSTVGPCGAGNSCPAGYWCDTDGYCCGDVPACPVEQQGGLCFNAKCPSGYACGTDYICCANATTICSPDVQAGTCMSHQCPSHYICDRPTGVCCPPQTCEDKSNNCHKWAETGFCSNPYLTHEDKLICIKTCGLC